MCTALVECTNEIGIDKRHLYMVLEYVIGGEFFTHLRNAGRLDTISSKFYSAQVALIFEYLHTHDFIYRDLKPENLLLDKDGYIKITDFGFAKRVVFKTSNPASWVIVFFLLLTRDFSIKMYIHLERKENTMGQCRYTLCGTPEYIAPEVLLNKGHGKGVDWWTLGILMYEMMVGQPPFVDDDPMGIYQQILNGKLNFPRFIERSAKSLIKKMLVADLTKRYGCLKGGAADIKKHKFFQGLIFDDMLSKQLAAPVLPLVKDEYDTSNYDAYPDSVEQPPIPVYAGADLFVTF